VSALGYHTPAIDSVAADGFSVENEHILFSFHTLLIEPSSRRIISNFVENVLIAIKRDPTAGATCIALSPDLGPRITDHNIVRVMNQ
jgi:hypothetical protein